VAKGGLLEIPEAFPELADVLVGPAPGGPIDGQDVDRLPHFHELRGEVRRPEADHLEVPDDFVGRHALDENALPLPNLQHPEGFEDRDGFPEKVPPDAEALRHVPLAGELRPFRVLAAPDHLDDLFLDVGSLLLQGHAASLNGP